MNVYPLGLNLGLTYEFYLFLIEVFGLKYEETSSNKTDQKRVIQTLIKDYIKNTLSIEPEYINIFLFRLKKSIYCLPVKPSTVVEKQNIQSLSAYKTAIKDKSITVPHKQKLTVNSSESKELITKIIKSPENYQFLKMNDSDSESESYTSFASIELDENLKSVIESDYPNTQNIFNTNLESAKEAADFPAFTRKLETSLLDQSPIIESETTHDGNINRTFFTNNLNANEGGTVKLQDYINEEASGSSDEWLDSQLFVITLKKPTQWTDLQKIGALLTAVKGDLGKQLNLELQRLDSGDLNLNTFRTTLSKLTKKSSSEYSRILDKMRYSGDITIREFYNKIYTIVKKLLVASSPKSQVDQKTCQNLSSTYLKSKVLRDNYHFQLSEKCGFDLVELAEQIQSINMTPVVSNLNKITTDKRNTGVKPEQNNWNQKNGQQYTFNDKNNIRPNVNYNRNITARPQYGKPRDFQQTQNFRPYQNQFQQFQPRAFQNTFRAIDCHYCGKNGHGWARCFIREREQPTWNPNIGREEGENDPYFNIDI